MEHDTLLRLESRATKTRNILVGLLTSTGGPHTQKMYEQLLINEWSQPFDKEIAIAVGDILTTEQPETISLIQLFFDVLRDYHTIVIDDDIYAFNQTAKCLCSTFTALLIAMSLVNDEIIRVVETFNKATLDKVYKAHLLQNEWWDGTHRMIIASGG